MRNSKLSELAKRKGRLISPWVDHLGDKLALSSWSLERLPEYIWMALILDDKGRADGIDCCIRIIKKIRACDPNFDSAKLSYFLMKNNNEQDRVFDIIVTEIAPEVLAPLTAVIDYDYSPSFYKHFFIPGFDLEKRLEMLKVVTRKFNSPDSHDTTDLRFLAIVPQVLAGHLHFANDSPMIEALLYYSNKSHEDEIMNAYCPCIRALEGTINLTKEQTNEWVNHYWNEASKATDCKLFSIKYDRNETDMDYNQFIEMTKEALNYLNVQNKHLTTTDNAFCVLTGSLVYAFKTFAEVIEHDLANTLIGRQAARIIIEVYIMMKYLILQESQKPNIWSEYQAYGIGKYKLILMKLREGLGGKTLHVSEKMLDLLVNEPQMEEFTDVDLRYFDDIKIREKAIGVGEKDLYDVAYDYDSCYAHGLWGAVRESCMLTCDNVFHHFHPAADATLSQNSLDVTADCYNFLIKLISLVNERYSFPEWYMSFLRADHE